MLSKINYKVWTPEAARTYLKVGDVFYAIRSNRIVEVEILNMESEKASSAFVRFPGDAFLNECFVQLDSPLFFDTVGDAVKFLVDNVVYLKLKGAEA